MTYIDTARGYGVFVADYIEVGARVSILKDDEASGFGLGAHALIRREDMSTASRPLESTRWAGGVDTVGSTSLARLLAETRDNGVVTACGLAGGHDLPTTVMPFILRGVRLQGINSVTVPVPERERIWQRVVQDLPLDHLEDMIEEITLDEVPAQAEAILQGRVRGRTVVRLTP